MIEGDSRDARRALKAKKPADSRKVGNMSDLRHLRCNGSAPWRPCPKLRLVALVASALTCAPLPAATISGTAGADNLEGTPDADTINGGAGADEMSGLGGNDTYFVDNPDDVVIEGAGEGNDRIKSSVSYTLPIYVEYLTLTGTGAINGTGNGLANQLIGNAANNVLSGKAGADTMRGGPGNDTYYVDDPGDVVVEAVDEGIDLVKSTVNQKL